jgi:PKD repeat protein
VNISAEEHEVIRGQYIYIYANGSDADEFEGDLKTEFSYRILESVPWENASFTLKTYFNGMWRIRFSPSNDMPIGDYEFRVGFYDAEGDFSNWILLSHDIAVLNNPPTVSNMGLETSNILRTESVLIHAKGNDVEDTPSELTPTFQYKPSDSPPSSWKDLKDPSYNAANDRYEVSFASSSSSEVGDYDLRVMIQDSDGIESTWHYLNESLNILNNVPSVLNLTVSENEMFRGEEVLLFADGEDIDMDEEDLVPTFEYSLDGDTWETTFLGTPEYTDRKWQVTFSAPINAQHGDYSFQVRFSDGTDLSNWMYVFSALSVNNHLPSVSIETSGAQEGDTVSFTATVADSEDSLSDLIFLWEFGDSETSDEQSPLHTYEESGTYTIKLTVTDDDGGVTSDTTSITVEVESDPGPGPGSETEEEFPLRILLIVIVCIVVVILLFLLMKRKKPEGEVEAWEPEAGSVETPPTPEAQVSPPLVPPLMTTPQPPPPITSQGTEELTTKNIKCPSCQNSFQVEVVGGPQKVTCPNCGTSGTIKM